MIEVECEICGTEMLDALDRDPYSDYLIRPDGLIVFPCPSCTTEQDSEMLELPESVCQLLRTEGGRELA